MNEIREFADWSDAFDYCREVNKPIFARVSGQVQKLFPSGHAKQVAVTWQKGGAS
jgi:hypothetical protein